MKLVPEGAAESISSQRDSMIVAWHEVPGTAPPQKEPSRRVRYDSYRCARRFEDGRKEISNGIGKQNRNDP
jgi:hypothetical protein